MIRTQIQFPDDIYNALKQLADEHEWSLAETVRRASEDFLRKYPAKPQADKPWKLPEPLDCGGDFLVDVASYNSEAEAIINRFNAEDS